MSLYSLHAEHCRILCQVALPYHIRVMVPCYKEDLDIVKATITAAAAADLPSGCSRTIYLCDDGKDPEKRRWIQSLGADFVYVSGRSRPKGEMNGKSGNLNNVCSQLYPPGVPIPGSELICIFDADQIAKKHFFLAMVPLFDGGDDVAMVLSPQAFHNLNLHTDIFNHSNIHFWEYMQVSGLTARLYCKMKDWWTAAICWCLLPQVVPCSCHHHMPAVRYCPDLHAGTCLPAACSPWLVSLPAS